MAFERSLSIGLFGLLALGCSTEQPRFALKDPVVRDQDLDEVKAPCRDPKKGESDCGPETYESSFAWDAADNTLFRPISQFFKVSPGGEAENVNAFDEAPDSSWWNARIGTHPMTPQDIIEGPCKGGKTLSTDVGDGGWLIDAGKDNGANPGFRVKVDGQKYMLKVDSDQPERATGATAISARFYYAAGWWAPCDSIVYFKRSMLKLTPGLKVKANTGPAKDFDEKMLSETLSHAARRGETYRAAASRWLPGKALGPFTYAGRRDDDPNDVIPHEDRRDLRGARVMAAWLNHFDSREQNSMDTWMEAEGQPNKGHVQHWYIDIGDSFGSEWAVDGFSRRLGYSFLLDFGDIGKDFITFGIPRRHWDKAKRTPGHEIFGYFSSEDFNPDTWVGEYPSPAFARLTERDGAWAARIIAKFSEAHVRAAVSVGDFTDKTHDDFLVKILLERQHIILARYFSKLSPISDIEAKGSTLCGVDLARSSKTWPDTQFNYTATVRGLDDKEASLAVTAEADGKLCVTLPAANVAAGAAPNDRHRYRIVKIANGIAKGPIEVHLYDLGGAGLKVAGLIRQP